MQRQTYGLVVIGTLCACALGVVSAVAVTALTYETSHTRHQSPVDDSSSDRGKICVLCRGPSLGFDGRLRFLPSLTPGVGL